MPGYGVFARYYDALTANVDYRGRAAFFDALITKYGLPENRLLLDLACGTGSLTVELAALGYELVGVDGSTDMLSIAMVKTADYTDRVMLLRQSMTGLDLYGTVGCTVCALDSINHLIRAEEVQTTFQRVALFTEPGGLFLFDANTPYKHREVLADNVFVSDCTQVYCVWQNRTSADGLTEVMLDFFEPREDQYVRSTECFRERAYPAGLLKGWLKEAGFTVEAVYGDDVMAPPHSLTERVIFVARRA